MDVFDRWHICNHTDGEGRYSYQASSDSLRNLDHFLTFTAAAAGDGVRHRQDYFNHGRC